MNNKIGWAVLAIMVLPIVWYLISNPSTGNNVLQPTATTAPVATTTQQPTATTASKRGAVGASAPKTVTLAKVIGVNTIAYLYSLKESLVCSVKTTAGYIRSGTLYVAEGQMRANFTNTSMIDDSAYLYVWTQGSSRGLKLLTSTTASGSAVAANGGFDPANPISFACNPWTTDTGMFLAPIGVTFSNTL